MNSLTSSGHLLPRIGAALAFLLLVLPAQLRPENFLADDTYFYLQVAHHIVAGNGSTFNTITPTNGYHPLWMLFCVASIWIAGGDKGAALHIVLAIQALLFLGIACLFMRLARRLGLRRGAAALPLLAIYFLTGLYGSEAHCNGLALLAALLLLARAYPSAPAGRWGWAGVAFGAAILARLDNVFIVGGVGLALLVVPDAPFRRRLMQALTLGLAALLVIAPYLLLNIITHGHAMPISGAIKSSFPSAEFHLSRLGLLGMIVTAGALLGLLAAVLRAGSPLLRFLLVGLGVGVLAQSAYILLFMRLGAGWSWYYVAGMVNLALVAALLLDLLAGGVMKGREGPAGRLAGGFAAVVLLLAVARGWYRLYDPYFTQKSALMPAHPRATGEDLRKNLALWMKEHLPPGSGIYVDDGAGGIAYYSDLRILPRDGLISDYRYNEELLALGAADYFRAKDIRYYLGPIDPRRYPGGALDVPSPLYRRSAGTIPLRDENILLITKDNPARGELALWKL